MSSCRIAVGRATTRLGGLLGARFAYLHIPALSPYTHPRSVTSPATRDPPPWLKFPVFAADPRLAQKPVYSLLLNHPAQRRLTGENVSQNVVEAEYAVCGEARCQERSTVWQLRNKDTSLPFDAVISANIGNPQQLDQKPHHLLPVRSCH